LWHASCALMSQSQLQSRRTGTEKTGGGFLRSRRPRGVGTTRSKNKAPGAQHQVSPSHWTPRHRGAAPCVPRIPGADSTLAWFKNPAHELGRGSSGPGGGLRFPALPAACGLWLACIFQWAGWPYCDPSRGSFARVKFASPGQFMPMALASESKIITCT
jgi:hypothetical protein